MNSPGALIGIITILGAGFGLQSFFYGKKQPVPATDLFAISWLLGSFAVSAALFGTGLLFAGTVLHLLITGLCAVLALSGCLALRRGQFAVTMPKPRNIAEWLLLLAIVVQAAIVCKLCFASVLGSDGLLVWEMKARVAFLNGGSLPHAYLADSSRDWTHFDYPLMLPFTELWLYFWIGDSDQFWIKAIFAAYYCASICFLFRGVRLIGGPRWLGLAAAAGLICIPCVLRGEGSLPSGYADFPLATFYLAVLVCLPWAARTQSRRDFFLVAILMGALPWLKHEGIILSLCVFPLALLYLRRNAWKHAWFLPLPGACIWLGWSLFLAYHHISGRPDHEMITLGAIERNASRLLPILQHTVAELLDWRHWSLLWIGTGLSMLALLMPKKPSTQEQRAGLFLSAAVFLPICIYAATYLFSNWTSYEAHFYLSFPRLVLQTAPASLLICAAAFLRTTAISDQTPARNGGS